MALEMLGGGGPFSLNYGSVQVTISGDDVSSSISVDLTAAPVGFNFLGNPPSAVILATVTRFVTGSGQQPVDFTTTVSLRRTTVTIVFSRAIASNEQIGVTMSLAYSGV